MGASLAVVAGPVGRGLDEKRRVESEAAVSCAGGAPRGSYANEFRSLSLEARWAPSHRPDPLCASPLG